MLSSQSSSSREIKKAAMKKITYEFLMSLLDDEDPSVQDQALIIFRSLLQRSADDIDEVLSNCKGKLIKKLEEKLNGENLDLIIQSLYVMLSISNGNDKQKNLLMDKTVLKKISYFLDSDKHQVRSVCVSLLNNLFVITEKKSSESNIEKRLAILKEYNILEKLEKIVGLEDEENEIKQTANLILNIMKKH
jgi:hypothetical protein